MTRKFNNKQNELVSKENIGDRKFYISRSVAVVGVIIIKKDDDFYVLMGKRGKGCPDFQGCWNMPCGYLDWNENATEAVHREVYEETGLDLNMISKSQYLKSNLDQPWYVQHEVNGNRQNVTLRFGLIIKSETLPDLTNEYCEEDEVEELRWININEVKTLTCAFQHDKVLVEYLKNYKNENKTI